MQLTYRSLSTDEHGISCLAVHSDSAKFYAFQGPMTQRRRIKRAFRGMQIFFHLDADNVLEPISYQEKEGLATALYVYQSAGELTSFLQHSPSFMHYAVGKKCGRALLALHSGSLTKTQKERAAHHVDKVKQKLYTYLQQMPRMPNDEKTIDSIALRFQNFELYKAVLRYGGFKPSNILVTEDLKIIFKPSASFGEGCLCEDLALMANECSDLAPCFVAGVIDGYFAMKPPAAFFIYFAMYSAINSLYRCSSRASSSQQECLRMLKQSERIQEEFLNFRTPYPVYLESKEVEKARAKCLKLGL